MKITKHILKRPLLVILITIFISVIGILTLNIIPLEMHPDIQIPRINVLVTYIGSLPSEIENEIITKLEEKIKKIHDIKNIYSYASYGKAVMTIEFNINVKISQAKLDVQSAVDEAMPDLPSDINTPMVTDIDLTQLPVLKIAMYSQKVTDLIQLRIIGEDLQSTLEAVEGVSTVNIYGGYEREMRILIDPLKLKSYNISITQISTFIKNSNLNLPGGTININRYEYPVRISGRIRDINTLRNSIIAYKKDANNANAAFPVRLGDIAKIVNGHKDVETVSRYNGFPSVSLEISKRKGYNTLKLTKTILAVIEKYSQNNFVQKGIHYSVIGDDSREIIKSTSNLFSSVYQGILIIFVVLWIGMGIKNGFIASLSIPFCFVFAIAFVYLFGYSLNTLIQFGLIIVIGMVVDGAIVILENIYRFRGLGVPKSKAVVNGVDEVGGSVTSSMLTTMAAFIPLMFMSGVTGKFMSFIPIAVLLALTGSYFFDHFLIPILAKKMMSDPLHKMKWKKINDSPLNDLNTSVKKPSKEITKKIFEKIITWSLGHKKTVALISVCVFILSLYILVKIPKEFFPSSDENQVNINITLPPTSSLERTDALVSGIEKELLEKYRKQNIIVHYISSVGVPAGTTKNASSPSGKATATITVELIDSSKRKNFPSDKFIQIIREFVSHIPNASFNINSKRRGPSDGDPINVVVVGKSIKMLKTISRDIQKMIKNQILNAVDITDSYGTGIPQYLVTINRNKANYHGITVNDIAQTLSMLYNGTEISNYYIGDNEIKIRVKMLDNYLTNPESLNMIYFYKSATVQIPFKEVAKVQLISGVAMITRINTNRAVTISGNVSGRSSTDVMIDVMQLMKNYPLPNGYSIVYKGENEDRDESVKSLTIAFIGALLVMYFIITLQLNSFSQPISILTTILLSLVGVAFGLLLTGSKLGMMAMFGMVALAGIVVNDAIVLVTYINQLRKENKMERDEAITVASKTRLRPIMMTTVTTAAGLLPLALGLGGSDSSYWAPMAWTIIFGIVLATLQTLIIVPMVYIGIENLSQIFSRNIKRLIRRIKQFILWVVRKIFKLELEQSFKQVKKKNL